MTTSRRIRAALAASVFASTLALIAPSPADATPPTGCIRAGVGEPRQTQASFIQTVYKLDCGATTGGVVISAVMHFHPTSGYNASHVVGCSSHVAVVDEDTDTSYDIPTACTGLAKLGKTVDIPTDGVWVLAPGRYHLTGWVNLQTTGAPEYETYPYASRYPRFYVVRR
jgi:hypothetical protein